MDHEWFDGGQGNSLVFDFLLSKLLWSYAVSK